MKFTTLLTAFALGATANAQRYGGPPGNYYGPPSNNYGPPSGGRPTGPPAGSPSGQYGPPPGYGSYSGGPPSQSGAPQQGSNSLGNPNIPAGQTQTGVANSYGGFKTIDPTIPTAIPSAAGNSTGGNTTLVSTSQDAKNNPNLPNSATHRGNWAPGFDINTNVETTWPNTGTTVKYTLEITNGTISPQGDSKIGFLINGQYPGPKLVANWGDWFEVTVINNLQNNGTSVHWHGFTQKSSNLQDGVGGVTECPLAPGSSRVYRFQATQYGTYWYHSHFSAQYGDGVYGPIVVNGPASYNYDIDLGTVMISDYYPLTSFQEEWFASRFGPPTATNYLLNGQNVKVDGSGGTRSQWTFTPGKKHLIRFMNTGADVYYKVQIDGHSLIVISSDLTPIQPYMTNELSIATGQRYDVIVVANQTPGNYWLRAMSAADCSFSTNTGTGTANGIISYSGAASGLPTTKPWPHSDACVDEPLAALTPIVTLPVASGSFSANANALPVGAGVVRTTNDTVFQWTIGGISEVVDWSNPTMGQAAVSNDVFSAVRHVVQLPNANAWTFWVLQNQFFVPHPMHIHGHNFVVLGQGSGTFNSASASSTLNFVNPPRRDTVNLAAGGWTVVAFQADNPGAWLMHCHIAWHAAGGLTLQYLEQPSAIPGVYGSQVGSSSVYQNTCAAWKKYAATMVYPQSDSGLKRREVVNGVEVETIQLEEFPARRSAEVSKDIVRRQVSHFV